MTRIRRSHDRGRTHIGWLDSYHTFSFGDYHDPDHVHYRGLRVINDDLIHGGGGFPTHPHRDMEIVTLMLSGRLAHKDSLGTVQELRPGEVQVMTAGSGIRHSEFNPSATEPAKLLQVWIMPERRGLTPAYDQRHFPQVKGWQTLASREGPLTIHADAVISRADLNSEDLTYPVREGRGVWLHVADGDVVANGHTLTTGDAIAVEGEPLTVAGRGTVFAFDLA